MRGKKKVLINKVKISTFFLASKLQDFFLGGGGNLLHYLSNDVLWPRDYINNIGQKLI